MVGVCGQFQLQNARESRPIRLSEEPRPFFLWVCPLYFAPLRDWAVIACLRIITREDSRRSSAPQSAALRRAPQPQRSATEEWRAVGRRERNVGREERRKREADWVVIKGLFFLPTGEHLHSSHLLRGDLGRCSCMLTQPRSARSIFWKAGLCRRPLPPRGSPTVPAKVRGFNSMRGWRPEPTAGLSDRRR